MPDRSLGQNGPMDKEVLGVCSSLKSAAAAASAEAEEHLSDASFYGYFKKTS